MNGLCFEQINHVLRRHYPRDENVVPETIRRLSQKLAAGAQLRGELELYALGVARNVKREFVREWPRQGRPAPTPPARAAAPDPHDMGKLIALLGELPRTERELIRRCFLSGAVDLARSRRKPAVRLGIEPDALRQRVHRILIRLRMASRSA